MNWKKNPALSWKLYPVPKQVRKHKLGHLLWNGVYCIIDSEVIKHRDPVKIALFLFRSGVKVVQLRYKNCPSYRLVRIAKAIQKLANKYGKVLLINDRADVALASGAGGVHIGAGDMPLRMMRLLLGPRGIIGKTVHSIKEAKRAKSEKADYVSAGPVFSTPLKKDLKKRGINFVRKIKNRVSVPVIAIGGINKRNIKALLGSGVDGVCVARAIFEAREILKLTKLTLSKVST